MDVINKVIVNLPLYKRDIIIYVCKYLCDEKFFYHDSIEDYVLKKEPTLKRKSHYHLNNIVVILLLLKYLLFISNPSETVKIELGEILFIYLTAEYKIAYIFIVFISLFYIMFKVMIYYQEINYNLKAISLLRNLGKELTFYSLNEDKQDRYILFANILFWTLRLFAIGWRITLLFTLLFLIIYIYFLLEYEFSIIILLISLMHVYLFYEHMLVIIIGGVLLIFFMIMFLKWKLDEIIKLIKISALAKQG